MISDAWRTTTMLAVESGDSLLLVDCGADVIQRLRSSGLDPLKVSGLLVTHEHADHTAGFPLMMEKLWVHGLRGRFNVYGIRPAIDQLRRVHDSYNTGDWPGYPEIVYHEVSREEGAAVLENADLTVTAWPGDHPVPVTGFRFTDRHSGGVMFYSGDTQPTASISHGALGASLLVHEATGNFPGHASAEQAAMLAASCGARQLVLVHVPPDGAWRQADMERARSIFRATEIADEGGKIAF